VLLRLFNFIYFQYIISMGLPSAPVPPRKPAAEIAGVQDAAVAFAKAGMCPAIVVLLGMHFLLFPPERSGGMQGPFKHHQEEPKRGSSTDMMGASNNLLQPSVFSRCPSFLGACF